MVRSHLVTDVFLEASPLARRVAQVRSARASGLLRTAGLTREDVEQEALMGIWRAASHFDPSRASFRTYVEKIVASTVTSLLRKACAQRRTQKKTPQSESLHILVSIELRTDVDRTLNKLRADDQRIAYLLADHTPAEIARSIRSSRPGVYRSIGRIRSALSEAGLGGSV